MLLLHERIQQTLLYEQPPSDTKQVPARENWEESGKEAVAERVGFEPTVHQKEYNGFRGRRLQPLGHLSARGCMMKNF